MTAIKYNLFLGSSIGTLKGVSVRKEDGDLKMVTKNLIRDRENISNKSEVKCLNWTDERRDEILIGTKDAVRAYNITGETLSTSIPPPGGETCGIFKCDNKIFVGLTSGSVRSFVLSNEEAVEWSEELKTNKPIERLQRGIVRANIVATGGKDNDLKLWDLNTNQTTFNAKNIKPDELQLQIPVWVSDIAFCRESESVVTSSRHGYVRLYDPLLPQRRPVFSAHQPDQVFTCISCTPKNDQFLVGSGTGDLFLVDVRGKNSFSGKYKGFTGAVKDIACPPGQSLVFSASLDRHFRIHDFSSKKLIIKEYVQTRLTAILPTEPFAIEEIITEKNESDETAELVPKSKNVVSEKDVKLTDGLFEVMEKIDETDYKKSSTRVIRPKKQARTSEESTEKQSAKRIKWKKNV